MAKSYSHKHLYSSSEATTGNLHHRFGLLNAHNAKIQDTIEEDGAAGQVHALGKVKYSFQLCEN